MREPETTTTVNVGAFIATEGFISISYRPEADVVQITLADPSDKRRLPHFLSLTRSDLEKFRSLVLKLETVITNEKAKIRIKKLGGPGIQHQANAVSVPIGESTISLPKELFDQVSELVNQGKTMVAASQLSTALPWLGMSGARAVAQSICDHQQAAGTRS